MQSLQTMSKAPTQPANLPPLQNLPSWSRNTLGRRKQPRPIIRDRLQPIKSIREEMDEGTDEKSNEKSSFSGRIVSAPSRGHLFDQSQRTDNIEKRLDYLRTQHAETLSNLHSEIERLKAENKGERVTIFSFSWIEKLRSTSKKPSTTYFYSSIKDNGTSPERFFNFTLRCNV